MSNVLHWGCADVIAPGMINSDRDDHGQEHVGDIRDGLPFKDGTFDMVVSHHTLQALAWGALVPALAELRRVTRTGGWLRLSVPDVLRAVTAYTTGNAAHFQVADHHEASIDGKLCLYLTQGGATRSLFTPAWLAELCAKAGWFVAPPARYGATASPWPDIVTLDTRPDESLFVEAVTA